MRPVYRPQLTPGEWREIAARYVRGETAAVLADEFGFSELALRQQSARQICSFAKTSKAQ